MNADTPSSIESLGKYAWGWLVTGIAGIVIVYVVVMNLGETARFVQLLQQAQPLWLLTAVALQIGTYSAEGVVWNVIIRDAGHRLPVRTLARLAVEKLSVNQLLPTAGITGNIFIERMLRRRGIPSALALEAMFFDILCHNVAFALMAVLALIALWMQHTVPTVVLVIATMFGVVIVLLPLLIWWLLKNRRMPPPRFLAGFKSVRTFMETIGDVSPRRILAPHLLSIGILFQCAIFLFDSMTLWSALQAVGLDVNVIIPFIALVIGSMASNVALLPGGIGSFEAACIAMLTLLDVSIEAALTSTLILRMFTFWLPMIPGIVLIRTDIHRRHHQA